MYIAILGNNPDLSRAELEAHYQAITPCGDEAALFEGDLYKHLGGSSKIAELKATLPTTDRKEIADYILESILDDIDVPHKKMSIGLSIYGEIWREYKKLVFELKKQARKNGIKPRMVLGKKQSVSSAQILWNHLTDQDKGLEIVVCIGKDCTYIGRTVWVQDIESYSLRDMQRPHRDMNVGMLPPKLAQIMVNLAGGDYIFDPYCGSGVILQEALLMGKKAGGSDLSPRMVDATSENLAWLKAHFKIDTAETVFEADARTVSIPKEVDSIVTEGYLGPLQHGNTSKEDLLKLADDSSDLMSETLKNLHQQLADGARLCIALPAWAHGQGVILPPLVDSVEKLGYNRIRLNNTLASDLLYMRDKQFVGRQLILLEKR